MSSSAEKEREYRKAHSNRWKTAQEHAKNICTVLVTKDAELVEALGFLKFALAFHLFRIDFKQLQCQDQYSSELEVRPDDEVSEKSASTKRDGADSHSE